MIKLEKKILEFIEGRLFIFILAAAFIAGALLRFTSRNFVSEDAYNYLLGWYDEIKACGGFAALDHQVGNYNVLYQTIIALFTYLPIPALFAYKGLSIVFDLLLACLVGFIVYKEASSSNEVLGVTAFSLIWLLPVVLFNSSLWAQCDSIYTFFVVLSLYLLYKEKNIPAFVVLGIALSFKLQAVFIIPFFLFVYFANRKFSFLNFLIPPAVMWVSTIPAIIAGRGVFTGFLLYLNQTDEYGCTVMNYPGFTLTMSYDYMQKYYHNVKAISVIITISVLAFWMIFSLWKKRKPEGDMFWLMAVLFTFTTVYFLPAMHDRYGYLYEILAVVFMFKNKKTILPCFILQIISMITYSNFLFHLGVDVKMLSVLNFIVYAVYCYIFVKDPVNEENSKNS